MRVWRLALGRFSELDGEGARQYGGRWNSPGIPMVYAATHLALALLEQLVHLNPDRLPAALRAFAIELSSGVPVEDDVPPTNDAEASRRYGDAWAASLRSAALIVPSVLVPMKLKPGDLDTEERNVLLNPRHRSAATWRVTETVFEVDRRLKRLA
ncbi:MAG TPA: RES domain-containing protein [Acetobacteraceae bacterium]